MNFRKNASLLVGLAIPLVLIIAVIVSIYIPRLTNKPPHYNFLYTSNNYYPSNVRFKVQQGKLIREELPLDPSYPQPIKDSLAITEPTFFLHDVTRNESREISFAEAQQLKLDPNRESPDGYSLQQGSNNGVFPFFYNGPYGVSWFLTGHTTSHKMNVKQTTDYGGVELLGWVIP